MLYISPFYLESAAAVYADFFESRLHRERMSTLGHWQGRGAQLLGLKNPVKLKALENLLNGLTPDGTRRLVADAGDPKRVAGWRITLAAPPLLNNLWAVAPREAHVRIERGFVQGVNRTLRCLEDVVTGVGTLAPRPDSPKAIMTVFRTNAAWDMSAELQATALLLNLGLESAQKAQTFSPSQIMGFEGGVRDFFERALTARLDAQISQFKSYASRHLQLDDVVQGMSQKAAMDADSRSTWARRDDRGIWNRSKNPPARDWQQNAMDVARVAQWTEITDYIGRPGELFAKLSKEFRGRRANAELARQFKEASEQQTENAETKRQSSTATKAKKQFHGHCH